MARPTGLSVSITSSLANARAPTLILMSGVVVVGASLALAFWPTVQGHQLALVDNMAEAGAKVIAGLLVVALILERGLAVFNDLLFGKARAEAQRDIVATPDGPTDVDTARERARLVLGLAAGLLISAAGVRTLTGLTTKTTLDSFQTAVDIWLTAGLLAGGSNGLAKLVDVLHESAAHRVSALRYQRAQADADRQALTRATKP